MYYSVQREEMIEIYGAGDAQNKEGIRNYSRNPYRNHIFLKKPI